MARCTKTSGSVFSSAFVSLARQGVYYKKYVNNATCFTKENRMKLIQDICMILFALSFSL